MVTAAQQAVMVQPNVFELSTYDMRISYSTTSFSGVAELTYVRRGVTLTFRGEQIRTERTTLGQMVSVSLNSMPNAIAPVESLSLLIPTMNLPADSKQGDIQTIAVLSLRSFEKVPAQSQSYMSLCLAGTAQQIDF
jgi:hypothetical protein